MVYVKAVPSAPPSTRGRPRKTETSVTPEEATTIRQELQHTLSQALAPTYWGALRRTYDRYSQFREGWMKAERRTLPHDEGAVLWVTKQRKDGLSVQSALQYLNNLAAALRRFAAFPLDGRQIVADYRRALKRGGALRPQKQAEPATAHNIREALAKEPRPIVKLLLGIMWGGAARASDALRLDVKDVTAEKRSEPIYVRWTQSKADPFHMGHITGISLPKDLHRILRHRLRRARSAGETRLFPADVTYRTVVKAVKRARRGLTAHSLRRGALTQLARKNVPLEEVRLLSRHATVDGVMRYVSAAENAHARETAQVSAKIEW